MKKNSEEGQRRSCPSLFSSRSRLRVASSPSLRLSPCVFLVCEAGKAVGGNKDGGRETGRVSASVRTFIHGYVCWRSTTVHSGNLVICQRNRIGRWRGPIVLGSWNTVYYRQSWNITVKSYTSVHVEVH